MLRKQLFKQVAVCVLAAGMIMSNIPCTQVNGIYASVDVTNSVTVNLSQKIRERVCQDDFCKFSKFKYLSAEKTPNISCRHIS